MQKVCTFIPVSSREDYLMTKCCRALMSWAGKVNNERTYHSLRVLFRNKIILKEIWVLTSLRDITGTPGNRSRFIDSIYHRPWWHNNHSRTLPIPSRPCLPHRRIGQARDNAELIPNKLDTFNWVVVDICVILQWTHQSFLTLVRLDDKLRSSVTAILSVRHRALYKSPLQTLLLVN